MAHVKTLWPSLACFLLDLVRYYDLPKFKSKSDKCTIIVESRKIPHLEFVLRKHYHHLDDSWSAIFVCTADNAEYVRAVIAMLGVNVTVWEWPGEIKTIGDYNRLMLNPKFWEGIDAEKVLIFQEDGFLLKDGIDEFMKYDYIGAPWPSSWQYTRTGVGNGGFSLRSVLLTKHILACFPVKDMVMGNERTLIDGCLPEDVYFSRAFEKFPGTRLPSRDEAFRFSCETSPYKGSVGWHALWNGDQDWMNVIKKSIKKISGVAIPSHPLLNHLLSPLSLEGGEVECVPQVVNGEKPLEPWIGFVHTVDNMSHLSLNSSCKGLITFSSHAKEYLNLLDPNIPVLSLSYPASASWVFSWEAFAANKDRQLVQAGGRAALQVASFYSVASPFRKTWIGSQDDFNGLISDFRKRGEIPHDLESVIPMHADFASLEDKLGSCLDKNIAFFNVQKGCAYNTILIQCIIAGTPMVINRCPMTEEYLGAEYPLFYSDLDEVMGLLSDDTLKEAHLYLRRIGKERFGGQAFVRALINSLLYRSLPFHKTELPTRLALIYNRFMQTSGGGERSTLAYALALKTLGFDARVITVSPMKWDIVETFGSEFSGIPVDYYPLKDIKSLSALKPSIFVNHSYLSYDTANIGRVGIYSLMFPNPINEEMRRNIESYNLVLSNSSFTKSYADPTWKLEEDRSCVLHPPIQSSFIKLANDILADGSLKKEKAFINVGRFFRKGHTKNQKKIILEFLRAKEKDDTLNEWSLHLVGNTNDIDYFNECVELAKEDEKIYFHQDVTSEELSSLLLKSYGYIHATGAFDVKRPPSQCEHFGLSILEAMAHGCIPIVFARGGIFDILDVNRGMGYAYLTASGLRDALSELAGKWTDGGTLSYAQKLCLQAVGKVSQEEFTKKLNSLLLTLL